MMAWCLYFVSGHLQPQYLWLLLYVIVFVQFHCIVYCLCIEIIYHIIIVLIKIFPDNCLWTSYKACGFVISILRLGYSLYHMSCEFMVVIGWIIYCILLGV